MVGIFTGAGSGLERGSANILGGAGLLGSSAFGRSGEQLLLNAATGNLLIGRSDEFLVGRGPDAAISRTYNSLGNATDENGDNWRQSTDRQVFGETGTRGTTGATVSRRSADGSEIVYTWNAAASAYVATDGSGTYDTLTYASGIWTWTDGDTHTVETYEVSYASAAQWRIKQVSDESGVAMSFAYVASSDHLDKVTTSDGGYIQYSWSGNNITQMVTHYTDLATSTAKTLTRVRYAYDGSNRLTSVTTDLTPEDNSVSDGAVYSATYTYDGTSTRVATITESDGTSIAIAYDATSHKVTSLTQTVASGVTRVTGVAYTSSTLTTITDPLGQITTLEYNADGSLKTITAPPAVTGATAQTTQFTYDGGGNVLSVTDPLNQVTTYGGYTNGNWTTQTDPLLNVVTRTYDAANNLTSETRTGSDIGASSAQHTTRYVYDSANRLIWLLSPRGLATRYEYDSYGQLTRTLDFSTRVYDISALSPTTMVSAADLDARFITVSDRSEEGIVAQGYDARGDLTATTGYATTDTAGNGLTANGYTVESYTYDQAGRLLLRSLAGTTTEHFVYDGLGRMTASTDVNGGTTSFVFTDSTADDSTKTTVTTAAGYVQVYTYNRAGDLISMIDSGTGVTGGTTGYQYDALGRVRVSTDANGNKTYTLYDHAGRKTADIDSYGFVREYRYDADNRVVATVRWTNAISGTNLTTLANPANTLDIATIRPASDTADIWNWTVYDADGRTVQTIEGDGSVTAYDRDASGQLIKTTIYANKLTSTQLTTIRATAPSTALTPTTSSDDSFSRLFYDKEGLVQGSLDFSGYLTRTLHNAARQLVNVYQNVDKVDSSIAGSGTLTAIVASLGGGASTLTRYVYDNEDRLRFVVRNDYTVTEYDYNEGTTELRSVRQTIDYAGQLPSTTSITLAGVQAALVSSGLAASADNRADYTVYDAAGRSAYAIDASGAVTGFGYDGSGRLIKTVHYATARSTASLPSLATMASWASANATSSDRVSRLYYTPRGEVAYSIDGEGYVTGKAYDAEGQLTTETLWNTPVTATDSWTSANVAAALSGTNAVTHYTYDPDGRVATMRDGEGHGHDYTYTGNGLLAWDIRMSGSSTDESKTKYVYDAAGRLTDRYDGWQSGSPATHYAYDGRGNQLTVTDPNGHVLVTRTFDGKGQILTETDALGGVTTYQYDMFGNVVKTTDPRGNSSYNYYDTLGRVIATRDAENYVTTTTYTAFNQVATVTRHSARATNTASTTLPTWTWDSTDVPVTTTYEYDRLGNVAKVTDPLTNYSQFTYNAFGEQSVIRDARGMLTSEAYDKRGLLKTEIADTAAKAITTSYTYNARGQVLTATDATAKVTTSTYDLAGRPATVKDALNNTTSYTYDGRDNLVAVTDARGAVTRTIYDANDRKIASIDALGGVTTYAYDADGHLTSSLEYKTRVSTGSMALQVAMSTLTPLLATNADDRTTRYAYDDDGRLRFTVDAKLHVNELEYDAAGNIVRTTAYDGAIPGTSFTTSGIATQVAALGGSPRTTRAVYDALGRQTYAIDATGHVTWSVRDSLNNVTKQVDYSIAYTASGNPSVATMVAWAASSPVVAGAANDRTTRAWYDADGRQTYSLDALGFVTRTEYDAGANITKRTRYTEAYSASDSTTAANLASFYTTPAAPQITQYTYDTAGRLTETLDGESNKTRVTLSQTGQVLTSTSAADTADAHVVTYTYDDVGRVLTQTVQIGTTPSGADLVTTNSYDAVGNLVKVHDARGNDSYSYYDALGQQIAMRDTENYVTETVYSTFGDALSVTRHSLRTTNTASTTLTSWTWATGTDAPATTLFEYDTLGQLTKSTDATGAYEQYTLGNFGERLTVRNKLGGTSSYTYDRYGNVLTETLPTGITTKTSGGTSIAVVNRYEYDSYGNRTKMVEADGAAEMRTTLYTYDKNDQLLTTVGDAVTVLSSALVASSYTPTQTLTYDSRGNVIKSVDADAQTFFYYDRNDRLVAQISPVGTLSTFAYDGNGNKILEKVFGTAVSLPGTPGGTPPTGSGTVRETRYAYDRANRLVSTTIPSLQTGEYAGGAWAFTTGDVSTAIDYDAAGNVTREGDGRGNSIYHWYDALGREVARIDQENYLTVWVRDAEGNATKETRYANKVTGTFTAATASTSLTGLLGTGATDANRITDFTYDKNGRRLTETRETVDYVAVDSSGTVTSGTASSVVAYTYDGLGHVLTKAEANGDTTTYVYDTIGRLTSETGQAFTDYAGATANPYTAYAYDGLNDLTSTRVQISASSTNTADRVTSYTYGAGGRLATMTDATGLAHTYGYDKAGRTVLDRYTRVKSDATSVTEAKVTLYDIAGRVTTQTLARLSGSTWLFTSELSGSPAYDAVNMAYDAFGDVTDRGLSSAGATVVYQEHFYFDAGGRLWKSNTGDGVLRFHLYDKAGNETLTLASTGADLSALTGLSTSNISTTGDYSASTTGAVTTVTVYDKRGQAISTREPDREAAGSTTTIVHGKTYNAFGEVLSETDALGYTTSYAYNSMGRMLSKVSPQVAVTDADGTQNDGVAHGGVTHAKVSPTDYYGYDLSGRLDKVTDANGNVTKRALLAGTGHGDGAEALVTKEFHADTGIFETKYDVFGDARSLVNELGNAETRTYDKMDRVATVTHRGAALTDNYVYDILGQRTGHWNSFFTSAYVETTDYDAQGRVTKTVGFAGDTMTYAYAWDAATATTGLGTFGGWTKTTTNVTASVSMTEKNDYFGRLADSIDYGSHNYDYSFDLGGRLTARSNAGGESIGFSYYNTGLISGQTGTQGTATDTYDAQGNRTAETLTVGGVSYRNASATYDALGRMTHWEDTGLGGTIPASTNWEYDRVGNVRYLSSSYRTLDASGTVASSATTQDYWYSYDAMNRFVITKGVLTGSRGSGTIDRGTAGTTVSYLNDGSRASAIYTGPIYSTTWHYVSDSGYPVADVPIGEDPPPGHWDTVTTTTVGERREDYTYNAEGFLTGTSRLDEYWDAGTMPTSYWDTPVQVHSTLTGTVSTSTLDALGRVTHYTEAGGFDGSFDRSSIVYDRANRELSETNVTIRRDTAGAVYTYYTTNLTNSYTGGLLTGQLQDTYKSSNGVLNTTNDNAIDDSRQTYSYTWWNGALQAGIGNDKDNSGGTPEWTTTYSYDASGHVASAAIVDGRSRTVSYKTDQNGMVVERREADSLSGGDPRELHYHYAGLQLGQTGNNGTDNLPFTAAIAERLVPAATTGGAFRGGTTTANPFADFEQSYDAINGAASGTGSSYTVSGGETLALIAQQSWGDSSLWYLIADANGLTGNEPLVAGQVLTIPNKVHNSRNASDTFRPYDPNQALGDNAPGDVKPPKKGACGVFGQILQTVVSVAVTAITGNPVLGNIVSQLFGMVTGIQQGGFNWKSLAITAITAGITRGLEGLNVFGDVAKGATGFTAGATHFANDLVRGALANGLTQGVAMATHLQKHFDLAGIAAAGVISAVGGMVDRGLAGGVKRAGLTDAITGSHTASTAAFLANTVSGAASSIAGAATRAVLTGTDFGDNIVAVLPDVIGSTFGRLVADNVGTVKGGTDGKEDVFEKLNRWSMAPIHAIGDVTRAVVTKPIQGIQKPNVISQRIGIVRAQGGSTPAGPSVSTGQTAGAGATDAAVPLSREDMWKRTIEQYIGTTDKTFTDADKARLRALPPPEIAIVDNLTALNGDHAFTRYSRDPAGTGPGTVSIDQALYEGAKTDPRAAAQLYWGLREEMASGLFSAEGISAPNTDLGAAFTWVTVRADVPALGSGDFKFQLSVGGTATQFSTNGNMLAERGLLTFTTTRIVRNVQDAAGTYETDLQPGVITRADGIRTTTMGVRLTGNEAPFEPARWNTGVTTAIQMYNNCYAYAVNELRPDRTDKPQPGERSGRSYAADPRSQTAAAGATDRYVGVSPEAVKDAAVRDGLVYLGQTPESTLKLPATDGYVVALIFDTRGSSRDYHWLRPDSGGHWSGKGGGGPATMLDASGRLVMDPQTADWDYESATDRQQGWAPGTAQSRGAVNYNRFGGYFYVPPNIKVGPPAPTAGAPAFDPSRRP